MLQRISKRLAILLPFLGFLLATVFVSIPQGSAQARTTPLRIVFSTPDYEDFAQENFDHVELPSPSIHRARKFHCRPRALHPGSGIYASVSIQVRETQHTGWYVLRHAEAVRRDIPTSSQYAYLFRLTPF
jgi:hypothetical protein